MKFIYISTAVLATIFSFNISSCLAEKGISSQSQDASLSMHAGKEEAAAKYKQDEHLFKQLCEACKQGNMRDVKNLAHHFGTGKTDINGKNLDGNTPLHIACKRGDEDIVNILVNVKGISLKAQDNNGKTPTMIAQEAGHQDIVALLTEYQES